MSFAAWEQILLVVLVLGTAALFGRDLSAKIAKIRVGKADRPRTDRIGRRLWTVVKEVVFQWRVVGGRPVAGGMHAVVFLGFAAFGLETTDHFLEPFGVPLLTTVFGDALPVFRSVLHFVAIAVSVAIVGLAVRRFLFPKFSPDPKSYSSGVVALMILLLMLTYLNAEAAEPLATKLNWWVHSLLIIVFPHEILRSKHFHILMAPVDIFFRTHHTAELLPLNLDLEALEEADEEEISFGLETMADVPWKMRMDFLTCVECRRCTDLCPANNSGQELDPRGFILAGRKALDIDGPVIGNILSETALGQCTTCGACESVCPVGIEHLSVLVGAKRAQALSTGVGMVAGTFLQTIERHGNPFSERAATRTALIEELEIPRFVPGETEYLLWMGCVWSYNKDARSSLEATLRVLNAAGVSFGVLASESCSGHHSRRQGEEMQFQTLARENIESIQGQKVQKVIAPCPHCLHSLNRDYPTLDESFEVETVHHSELIAQLVSSGRLTLKGANGDGRKHTYHDPCYLGRYEGVYDPPRDLIRSAGHELVELPRNRRKSFCCGGGAAGFASDTEIDGRRVDQERSDEIKASGAEVLVTGCPECKMMLGTAAAETKDLAELVAESLA